jgi:hypothetical protein
MHVRGGDLKLARRTNEWHREFHQRQEFANDAHRSGEPLGEHGQGIDVSETNDFLDLSGRHAKRLGSNPNHHVMNRRCRIRPGEYFLKTLRHTSIQETRSRPNPVAQ